MAYKLILPPDQAAYSVVDPTETIRQQLDGGAGRYRRDIIGGTSIVNCQWSVGPEEYQYLKSFYKTLSRLSTPFLIDLYLDSPYLTEHNANFIPGSWRLSEQRGLTFVVSCQLEAEPIESEEYDLRILELVQTYGSIGEASKVLNYLEKLVNIDLPKINIPTIVPTPDPEPEPQYPENALANQNGDYLVDGSGAFLYGPVYVAANQRATDESGNILMDENSNYLIGEFA